jgi:CBS domain-containing protein
MKNSRATDNNTPTETSFNSYAIPRIVVGLALAAAIVWGLSVFMGSDDPAHKMHTDASPSDSSHSAAPADGDQTPGTHAKTNPHAADAHSEGTHATDVSSPDGQMALALMSSDFVVLDNTLKTHEAIALLKHHHMQTGQSARIYIVNKKGVLVGRASPEQLLLAPEASELKDAMERDVISVEADAKSAELVELMEKNQLAAVPVVDDRGRPIGLITADKVDEIRQRMSLAMAVSPPRADALPPPDVTAAEPHGTHHDAADHSEKEQPHAAKQVASAPHEKTTAEGKPHDTTPVTDKAHDTKKAAHDAHGKKTDVADHGKPADSPAETTHAAGHGATAAHGVHGGPPAEPKAKGVAFVEATIAPLDYELNKRFFGWRPNDIIEFTDNVNSYQLGVLEVTRRAVVILAERISRTGTMEAFNENVENAMNWLMVKAKRYWLPSPEAKYNAALEELRGYRDNLEKGKAAFYTRTDNLIPLLAAFGDLLGSCEENLVKEVEEDGEPVSFFMADQYFYYAQGVASAMGTILEAVAVDFYKTIDARRGTEVLHHAIEACHHATHIHPWIIFNSSLSSLLANHRVNLAAPISHARFYVGVLIKTLST